MADSKQTLAPIADSSVDYSKVNACVGDTLLVYLEAFLTHAAQEIEAMTGVATQRLRMVSMLLDSTQKPEIRQAISDVTVALQAEDRHRQRIQNAVLLLIAYRELLQKQRGDALSGAGGFDEQSMTMALERVLSAVKLGDMRNHLAQALSQHTALQAPVDAVLSKLGSQPRSATENETLAEELWL